MWKYSIVALFLVSPALAQSTTDDLREAYTFCTKRYIEHDAERKKIARWQSGFENCDKIVSSWEASQRKWNDVTQHKSKIDAIAGAIK